MQNHSVVVFEVMVRSLSFQVFTVKVSATEFRLLSGLAGFDGH